MKRVSLAAVAAMALMSLSAMAFDHHHQTWKDPMHNVQSPRAADAALEAQIAQKASVAPRVTPADVENAIASEHYFTAWNGVAGACDAGALHQRHADTDTLSEKAPAATPFEALSRVTICALVLRNGHQIVGVNYGPVSSENFRADVGRELARANAVDQIWLLLGFRLRDQLQAAA